MAFKKYQIAILFVCLVLISFVSCTKSINLQFGKNQDQLDQGSNFTLLKKAENFFDGYYAASNFHLNYGDIKLDGYQSITFTVDPFTVIPSKSLDLILQEFKRKGIMYLRNSQGIFLNSIEKLERITIEAIAEDDSVYPITLNPEQYTNKVQFGQYQLLLKPIFYSATITIGSSVLQTYNVIFDSAINQIQIAKKD